MIQYQFYEIEMEGDATLEKVQKAWENATTKGIDPYAMQFIEEEEGVELRGVQQVEDGKKYLTNGGIYNADVVEITYLEGGKEVGHDERFYLPVNMEKEDEN